MNRPFAVVVTVAVFVLIDPASAWADPWDKQINRPNRFTVLTTNDPANSLSASAYVWCARGGQGLDIQ